MRFRSFCSSGIFPNFICKHLTLTEQIEVLKIDTQNKKKKGKIVYL